MKGHRWNCMCRYCIEQRQDHRIKNLEKLFKRPLKTCEIISALEYGCIEDAADEIKKAERGRPKEIVRYPWKPYPCIRNGKLVRLNDQMEVIGEQP